MIPELGRLKQVGLCGFQASQSFIVRSCVKTTPPIKSNNTKPKIKPKHFLGLTVVIWWEEHLVVRLLFLEGGGRSGGPSVVSLFGVQSCHRELMFGVLMECPKLSQDLRLRLQ